jgi:hypothetical protein
MSDKNMYGTSADVEIYNVFVWNKQTAKRVWEHLNLEVTNASSPSRNNIEKWALICAEIKADEIEMHHVEVALVVCWNF